MQAADLEKDCNSFTVFVCIGLFVLGVWGITRRFVFSGTGLLGTLFPVKLGPPFPEERPLTQIRATI